MKQTVVEWLLDEIIAKDWWYLPESMKQDIFEQAKEMEKQQIIDFADEYGTYLLKGGTMSAASYNETFKSNIT